jgi:dTDP-4-amino-4,6-dideoxygalactose transaminase
MSPPRYIGGPFEFPPGLLASEPRVTLAAHFGLDRLEHAFVASGRSALALALERLDLSGGAVLVPDFQCVEALHPVLRQRNLRPVTFPVGPGFDQSPDQVLEAARRAPGIRAVILTAYFGLTEPEAAGRALADTRPDLPVILDSVQDLAGLARAQERAEWAPWQAFSLHKFLPVPHGGLLVGPGLEDSAASPQEFPAHSLLAFAAAQLRAQFLQGAIAGEDAAAWEQAYVAMWAEADAALPPVAGSLPTLSRLLLEKIDVVEALERRRGNLAFLMQRLRGSERVTPVVGAPPANAAPLALPVLVRGADRDGLRRSLREQGMFCPVHWPLPEDALATAGPYARRLAAQILSLPLDQRYRPDDLERLAAAVEGFAG